MIFRPLLIIILWLSTFIAQSNPPKINDGRLFYIQRTNNKNTVIYEANFDTNGKLNATTPIKAYWIMYEENGEIENLNLLERKFGYGVKVSDCQPEQDAYVFTLVSKDDMVLKVKQTGPFKAKIYYCYNGKDHGLHHIQIDATTNGLFSKVRAIDLYLHTPTNNDLKKYPLDV